MLRDPIQGEIWNFSSDESHAFLMLLKQKLRFSSDNPNFNEWITILTATPNSSSITIKDTDRVLFESLLASAREYAIRDQGENRDDCFIDCGEHGVSEHLAVIEAWSKNNIVLDRKFVQQRNAISNASLEERLFGKKDII